jgi:hypothetical protein
MDGYGARGIEVGTMRGVPCLNFFLFFLFGDGDKYLNIIKRIINRNKKD